MRRTRKRTTNKPTTSEPEKEVPFVKPLNPQTRKQLTDLVVRAIKARRAYYSAMDEAQDALEAHRNPKSPAVIELAIVLAIWELAECIFYRLDVRKAELAAARLSLQWPEVLTAAMQGEQQSPSRTQEGFAMIAPVPSPADTALAFGLTLSELLARRELSVEVLAKRTKLETDRLEEIKNGLSEPTVLEVFSLACALDVAPSELVRRFEAFLQQMQQRRVVRAD
jgi:hypothetical protein